MEGISFFYSLVEKRISIDFRFGKFNDAAISTLIDLHLSSRSILILFRRFFSEQGRTIFYSNDNGWSRLCRIFCNGASVLADRILPIVQAEWSFVTALPAETLETIAPGAPANLPRTPCAQINVNTCRNSRIVSRD